MVEHIKWPSVASFANVRKLIQTYPQLTNNKSEVTYMSKCKLHGTNAGIRFVDGDVYAQSRTQILSKDNDNAGFFAWVDKHRDEWKRWLSVHPELNNWTLFLEWVGPGVQNGCAVQQIPNKVCAVYAMLNQDELVVNPPDMMLSGLNVPDIYVIPFESKVVKVNWNRTSEELQPVVDEINSWVEEIEKCDPWVKNNFGIEGIGEGLVFYPVSPEHLGKENFSNLAFKAKGEKHKVVKTKKAVQVDPEKVNSVNEFVDLVVTEPRLEQMLTECLGDKPLTYNDLGKFIGAVSKDVNKECQAELEAAGLEWRSVLKEIGNKSRRWYIDRMEKE